MIQVQRALAIVLALLAGAATAQGLVPFSLGGEFPPAAWQLITLPKIERQTRFSIVTVDGARVLELEAERSHAGLTHAVAPPWTAATHLRWRWRVDRAPLADLHRRSGDDAPLRVCALFDLPLERLSLVERTLLRLERAVYIWPLPAASLCYVWDLGGASGSWFANPYTNRVRMLVLRGGRANLGGWFEETRDLHADFAAAFPREAQGGLPPLIAVTVSADTDNTGGSALAYLGDVVLSRP